jgi:hypothetical protein
MREELVEHLSGSGDVSREHGAAVGHRRYHIAVWQELHNTGALRDLVDRADGRKKIMGTIELLNTDTRVASAHDLCWVCKTREVG